MWTSARRSAVFVSTGRASTHRDLSVAIALMALGLTVEATVKILMSVQPLLVYVEMDDVLILLAASVAIVSQDTPSPLTECDAEISTSVQKCHDFVRMVFVPILSVAHGASA